MNANANEDERGLDLGIGVAAFGHDAELARTLETIDGVLREAGLTPASRVVASADGAGQAEAIATAHGWTFRRASAGAPRSLGSAREAARRACGGAAQLLVDGDVEIQPGWIVDAVEMLRTSESLAGVSGVVNEAHWAHGALLGGRKDVDGVGAGGPRPFLRDAALWRRSALDHVGGFDPWLPSEEEAELGGRLATAGFALRALGRTIGVRHGVPRDSWGAVRAFAGTRAFHGPALVLVRSRGTMAFGRHARRYLGPWLLVLWTLAAVALAAFTPGLVMVWLWATFGLLAFFGVLAQSATRPVWRAVLGWLTGVSAARAIVLPVGLPRLGLAPRPIEVREPREARTADHDAAQGGEGGSASSATAGARGGIPFRTAPRDPDDPPPLVVNE